MKLPLYQVDAFTDRLFAGNPAAVMPLEEWLPDAVMQNIAAENNLSETAFYVPSEDENADFELRWFTPKAEVNLCGHATLATAHVLFEHRGFEGACVRFSSKSGSLRVAREDGRLELDFPGRPLVPLEQVQGMSALLIFLGGNPEGLNAISNFGPTEWFCTRSLDAIDERMKQEHLLIAFESEREVSSLEPPRAGDAPARGIIATAPSSDPSLDFVSRYFAPAVGIPEDPVTGSAHCMSAPYWARRLEKTDLRARQISERGGDLHCRVRGDRVLIGGQAVTFLEGVANVPDA